MILKELHIRRANWDRTGHLEAVVEFISGNGEIKLNLDEAMSKRILELCADEIVKASKVVADHMTAEVITALPAPEKKTA